MFWGYVVNNNSNDNDNDDNINDSVINDTWGVVVHLCEIIHPAQVHSWRLTTSGGADDALQD